MASVSLFSIGKSVLEKLGPLVQQEAALLRNLQTELEKLEGTVSAIQALLLDAEEQQEHSHQVKDWLDKLEILLYDAEDLLDDVATEALRKELAARHRDDDCRIQCWTVVCFLFSLPNQLVYGLKMAHKIKSLREQLDAIYDDNIKLQLSPRFQEKGKMRNHNHNPTMSSIPNIFVGREDDLKQIKKLLLMANNSRSTVSVVSIVGIGGMGKTALAQLIYNDREVREHFVLRLWSCVSESCVVKLIIPKILESATKEKKQDLELETLTNLLEEHISGKKYFLVLDDIWNFNPEEWDKLISVLRSGASGSKILITTRFENFARMMSRGSPSPPYALNGLSSPQSWSLFRQVVFGDGHQLVDVELENVINVEEIKIEIMKKSAGVPLAVKTIANILYFKDPQIEWLPFLRSNELLSARHENSMLHNLKLSYDYLPSHLKRCFAFCSLFPKNAFIGIRELIHAWVAMGFIRLSPHGFEQSLLDLGHQYFMDLAWRSFFQEIKQGWSNDFDTCKMHDLMHELAVSVAGSSSKEITTLTEKLSEKTRHVFVPHNVWCPLDLISYMDKVKHLQIIHIMFVDLHESDTNFDESTFKTFVSKFRSLRALELTNFGMEMLPHHVQELKHLRFLGISCSHKLTRLPDSIVMLQNLQVLVLDGCKSLQMLPKDIKKLVNLCVLNCSNCFALTHMPVGLGELTGLETLTRYVVGRNSFASKLIGGLDELYRLDNLRGVLRIVNLGHLHRATTLSPPSLAFKTGATANLTGKPHLEDLYLQWDDGNLAKEEGQWKEYLKGFEEDVEWDENLLEGLQPHSNIKMVGVSGYIGGRCPSWISSLTHLHTLGLTWCKVHRGLHHLQGLPILQRLDLVGLIELDYIDEDEDEDGDSWVMNEEVTENKKASKPFFPSLQKLKLMGCPKLKGWRRKPPRFPKLSKLIILGSPLLTEMPLFPTLDKKLLLEDTSLQPLLCTMNFVPLGEPVPLPSSSSSASAYASSSSEVDVMQYPLSKLKKLHIKSIHDPPKEWLQGMQHLTSLQEVRIENSSGLEETLDWHNISHVPNFFIDEYYINKESESFLDDDNWNNFRGILQWISEDRARKEAWEDSS